jgi:hypothetical protein
MPISTREIVEGSVLRQIAEYPLPTTINKVTQNVYQINDKLLVIKELQDKVESDEWIGEFEVEFNSDDFKPFYSSHDFYIAFVYKSWGNAACLLTPKDVERLLNLDEDEEDDETQTLTVKSVGSGKFEVTNSTRRKRFNNVITNNHFPRNFFGNVPFEDEFDWLDDEDEDEDELQSNNHPFDLDEAIEIIKACASQENYEVTNGTHSFEIYTKTVHGLAFLVKVITPYIQVHLYEKTSEQYGKCTYSLRDNDSVARFCDILRISKRIQARTRN